MNTPYLLVWFKDSEARVAELAILPNSFVYGGQTFHHVRIYFGDVDYLRDDDNRLVGFGYAFAVDKKEIVFYEELLSQSPSVKREDGMLVILLKSGSFKIECVQAIGSEMYRSPTGALMLAVPNSGFGDLAFKLISADIPWPEHLNDDA